MYTDNSTARRPNVKDIAGQAFGDLTAISYAGNNLGSQAGAYWLFRCKCGIEKVLSGRAVRSGNVKSCGCSKQRTDETGNKYNKLTVLEFSGKTKGGDSNWLCQCECGNTTIVSRGDFTKGDTKSCGCHRASAGGATKGYRKSTEYVSWSEMKRRCYNTRNAEYHNYGGRGITVCDQWKNSFVDFLAYVGKKPSPDATIDRIDVNGNYEPGNVRWATKPEQSQNTRKTRKLTYNGETLCLREWARRLCITHQTISTRLAKGWPLEKVLSSEHYFTPPPKRKARPK